MAIINNHIQQAAGADNITLEQLNSNQHLAGLYKVTESVSIYRSTKDESIYYMGQQAGATLYRTYEKCSAILCGDVIYDSHNANYYNPTVQIIFPYNDDDPFIKEYFVRYNNDSGAWSTLTMFQAGESVRSVLTEQGYCLVDNSDSNRPIILSDRTKVDKTVNNYSFTGGRNYKPGEVISTSASPDVNGYVVAVDPDTGEITKLALVDEPLTDTNGEGADIQVNTEIEGSFVVFDKMGRIKESDIKLKASWLKPYEFTFRDTYDYELTFDTKYDQSELAGGATDYGFGFAPNPFNNFDYIVVDKDTGERLEGTATYDYSRAPYISKTNPGSLVWYGIVDNDNKVVAISEGLTGYKNGDTFEFTLDGTVYTGEVLDVSQNPWSIRTSLADDAGSVVTGYVKTKTLSGTGEGLTLYIRPITPQPGKTIGLNSIPDGSLAWSGIKVKANTSMVKLGSINVPFQFNFDMTINGEVRHFVEYNTITVNGHYGIHPSWLASNYNTVTPNSEGAEGWKVGDSFTVLVKGNTYKGQVLDINTNPYTITYDIPQTTDSDMTGTYIATPVDPAEGTGLFININTVQSYTYKLDNIYVDPHGGYDPAFYANSQVDILLAMQRVQAGTVNNIIAFSGVEGRFNELVRKETISKNKGDRSHYAIPTELAITSYIENMIDNDTIANLTDKWISEGLQHNLNKSSGQVASSVLIPYADSSTDGLIKKEMFNKVNEMAKELLSLQGLDFIAAELGENPTQAIMDQKWDAAGKGAPVEGNKIINVSEGDNQGHNWMYLTMGGTTQWYDIGSSTVAIATNSIQGLVMGTPPVTTYEYYPFIVKQTGSAASFINDTLTTTAAGAEHFTVRVNNTDSEGNIIDFSISPKTGTTRYMLSNIPFIKQKDVPLYYVTSYAVDTSAATGYVTRENFSIDGTPYVGAVINATTNPILAIANIPTKSPTDISGTYTTTSTSGSGKGLKVTIKCEPYYESVVFRLNITSWEDPCDTVEISDTQGHMKASGVKTLTEQVKFLYKNKADKQEIDLTSKDGTIAIKKPEGFEDYPRFDLSFNLATSTVWITLTPLLDGNTQEFNLTTYLQGVSTSNLEFYYGDGILVPGVDYNLQVNCKILNPGIGYKVGEVVMLNNDTRGARVVEVDDQGKIVNATVTTALVTPTDGNGADISAEFIYKHLKNPAMNSADNRTFMVKGVKLALISDLSGITEVVDPSGTLNAGVQGNVATVGINVDNVFKANKQQPCYMRLSTLQQTQGVLTEGSIYDLLQSLSNNMNYVMKNAVWKYKTNSNRVEIAVQDEAITPKNGVDIINIRPSDLGQITPDLPIQ